MVRFRKINTVNYESYQDRTILEERGSLGLYSDNLGRIYTSLDGVDIYFKWNELPGGFFTKNWYGSHTWDFFAAEKQGEDILLVTRTGFDHLNIFSK